MNEKKEKNKETSLGSELRRVQTIPLNWLSHQLGVEFETARLIQTLVKDFLGRHGEEAENPDSDPERPIFFHKSGCQCKWCKLE